MGAFDALANLAIATIATAPSPATSGGSLILTAGEGARFPTPPFNAIIWPSSGLADPTNSEIVRVTAVATDTLSITRTQEGSSARTVVVGDYIAATITSKTLADVQNAIPSINVKSPGYGAVGNFTADDTAAIQNAINDMHTAGGGVVHIPAGTYRVTSTIYQQENVKLQGAGHAATVIKQGNGANLNAVVQAYTDPAGVQGNARMWTIRDLRIDGNKSNQTSGNGHGLVTITTPLWTQATNDSGYDMHGIVDNVHIWYCRGDGYNANGRGEHCFKSVFIRECDGHGFFPTADSNFNECVAGVNGLNGFNLSGQASLRLTGCKSWYSGQKTVSGSSGHGYYVDANTTGCVDLAGCEAQDNKAAGFKINNSSQVIITGSADSNSTSGAGNYSAVELAGSNGCIVDVVAVERQSTGTQSNFLKIATSVGNMIRGTHRWVTGSVGSGVAAGSTTTTNDIAIATYNGGTVTMTRVTMP